MITSHDCQNGFACKSSRPSLLIKRSALGNLKASFHCTHWHRFFPLKKVFFRIPPSPFPKGAPHPNQAFSIVFTTSSVPLVGDRNLRRKDVTALRCSEPLRSKVGGPSKVFARFCGMGPPCYSLLIGTTIFVPHCSIDLHWSSLE